MTKAQPHQHPGNTRDATLPGHTHYSLRLNPYGSAHRHVHLNIHVHVDNSCVQKGTDTSGTRGRATPHRRVLGQPHACLSSAERTSESTCRSQQCSHNAHDTGCQGACMAHLPSGRCTRACGRSLRAVTDPALAPSLSAGTALRAAECLACWTPCRGADVRAAGPPRHPFPSTASAEHCTARNTRHTSDCTRRWSTS